MTCLEWHFGQVGQGAKRSWEQFFWPKFLVENAMISCSEWSLSHIAPITTLDPDYTTNYLKAPQSTRFELKSFLNRRVTLAFGSKHFRQTTKGVGSSFDWLWNFVMQVRFLLCLEACWDSWPIHINTHSYLRICHLGHV